MIRLLLTFVCLAVWFSVTVSSQPVLLGTLTPIFHETSGTLYAIDEKTFFIQNFRYDGQGVSVYVYIYLTGQMVERSGGTTINWNSTRTTVPRRRFISENITISLTVDNSTADLNVSNIQTFTIWCEPFAVFFTRLDLPTNISIPRTVGPTVPPVVPSCVQLDSDFQLQCGCISEGVPPDIDEGPFIPQPPDVMPGDMTVSIGTPIYGVDGFNVTMVCNILNGTCPITIMWLHNGAPYAAGGNISNITVTDYNDGDVFTCRADNIVGFDIENTTINVIATEEDCSVTMISGRVRHNQRRNRTRFRFSSDGDPKVTYRCKLDDGKFDDCKTPMSWRNLNRGRHTIAVKAFCVDDEGKRSSTVRRNFNFRIR